MEMPLNYILIYRGLPILTIIMGVGLFLYFYLEVGFKSKFTTSDETRINDKRLQKQFFQLKEEIDQKIKGLDKKELHSQNIEELIDAAIGDKIDEKVLDNFKKNTHQTQLKKLTGEDLKIILKVLSTTWKNILANCREMVQSTLS